MRPIPAIAQWVFTSLVSISKISPWVSVFTAPFFFEYGRVALDRNGPLIVNHKLITGVKISLDLAEKTQRSIYSSAVYEKGLTQFVLNTLKPGDTFVDIGANVGYFTLLAASLGAQVVSIEPYDQNVALLKQNIDLNNFKDIKILDIAIGDHEGTATLHINPLNRGGNSLLEQKGYFTDSHGYSREQIGKMYAGEVLEKKVKLTTLDSIAEEYSVTFITILKIDVEGFEGQVIEGMKKILSSGIAKHVLCEVSNKQTRNGILELFANAGYEYYSVDQDGKPLEKSLLGRDVVFTKT
ncbi:hypothetical protein A2389_03115 [Candidatus Adlerbacteria bacterium RIFOXYB1_FULL_48_10]|nr:MAG: hypothetical protein A2389_03115 [Candidatus Adlerbacteria bacterium RIFOXYB1_FULL_48_10]